jgi:hypothetical protein
MDSLVKHLASSKHRVTLERSKSAEDLQRAIGLGYLLVNFPETKGGTELGITLNPARAMLENADFAAGSGTIYLAGTLVLNYNHVEVELDVDLATLEGRGCLKLIADEVDWRAQRSMRQNS